MWALKHDWKTLILALVAMVTQGRAALKLRLLEATEPGAFTPPLPWDERVVAFATAEAEKDRTVKVVTGSATPLVARLLAAKGLSFEVVGTHDAAVNLVSTEKKAFLVRSYGVGGFDYMGNSRDDLPVWRAARTAFVCNASPSVEAAAQTHGNVAQVFPRVFNRRKALIKQMRPHQWLKNALVAVPLITAHAWATPAVWGGTLVAFAAFCMAASGAYALNDLLDIQDDRAHATKHKRPLASGALPLGWGLLMAPALMLGGLMLGLTQGLVFTAVLLTYMGLTLSYSWWLKRMPMVDVTVLSGLYGIRMVGGAVAGGIVLSHWLLLFGFFVFFSLALMKRYIEVRDLPRQGKDKARGYHVGDADILAMMGVSSGLMGAVVLALYTNSPEVRLLYATPELLGVLCPTLTFILSRMWLIAHRGTMHDDPVLFAARDRWTWVAALVTLALMAAGSL